MRLPVENFLPLAALSLLAGCGGGARSYDAGQNPAASGGPSADFPMVVGAPFAVDGVTYTPVDTMNYDAVGYAAIGAEGGAAVTAAHRTLPLPSYIEVTALDTGKTILVRAERRGPMSGRTLVELSPGAAVQLGIAGNPRAAVRVRRMNPVEQDRALLRMGQPAPARMDTPKSLLTVLGRKLDQQDGIIRPVPVPITEPSVMPAPIPAPTPAPAPLKVKPGKAAAKPIIKAPAKPNPAPKPAPVPAPVPASAPKTAQAPAPKPAPKAAEQGKFAVQVGAFANRANADAAARQVGATASPAGKLWRVRMGPFGSAAEAKAALAKAKAKGYSDARIQRAD